ncbi:FliH/SctL family protein [Bacterioplanoides sp.]|uniref:FliH/SctL family protein n=1 Tax=Bacterioplanoides sp. TaxID=2066072 RepID=UPI003AFFD14A
MTDYRQNHHFHPIASEEIKDDEAVKPWRLPFWTEKPAWLVEKEKKEQQAEQARQHELEREAEPETFPLPTAEELENIRRDAYNAGLEQGLIEGRQQGEKQGHEQGLQQGLEEGRQKGEQEGRQQGFASGEAEGLAQGQQQIQQACEQLAQVNQHLQANVVERDRQLPEVLARMISNLTEQLLGHELSVSQSAIGHFLQDALREMPAGEKDIQVYLSATDLTHLDKSGFDAEVLHFHSDPTLQPGECRLQSTQTLVEYSLSAALSQRLEQFIPRLLKASDGLQTDFEREPEFDPVAESVAESELASEPEQVPESAEQSDSQPESVEQSDSQPESVEQPEQEQPQNPMDHPDAE